MFVYPAYLYIAAIVTERMNLTELTQACTMALLVVIIDFPYDIMGIKTLMWTWHDTDSNLYDRNYWVPITSYYFHATFASSFNLIYNKARRHFVGLSGTYGSDELHRRASVGRRVLVASKWAQELKAAACAGLLSMPCGILQFIPLFHYFKDVWEVHSEVTMVALGAIYFSIAFYGVNHSWRPVNVLEQGQREERKGSKKWGKGKWYVDEIVLAVLIHFTFYMTLVVFAHPETYQVYGLHQQLGSMPGSGDGWECDQTREVTYPYPFTPAAFPSFLRADWFQNVTVKKRPYLCPDLSMFDEGYYNFDCEMARNQTLVPGQRFYWICGTGWDNDGKGAPTSHIEYVLVIWLCGILGMHALIQPLVFPRTLFEQFAIMRTFPRYFKFDKPRDEILQKAKEEIVDCRVNEETGKEELLLLGGDGMKEWIEREEFEHDRSTGPVYAERNGLYGTLHDTYGKASLDRARTFVGYRHAVDRLNILGSRVIDSASVSAKISYAKGYPEAVLDGGVIKRRTKKGVSGKA